MPYWKLYYHIVWATKYRKHLTLPTFQPQLHRVIAAKSSELGATVHALGGIEDHFHLAVSVPPKMTLSNFIGLVKDNSSHFVNHVIQPDILFKWQAEYGIHSFGQNQLRFIARYVQNQ